MLQGTWNVVEEDRAAADIVPTLTFDADGELRGFDGCNSFIGRWMGADRGAELEIQRDDRKDCVRGRTALQSTVTVVVSQDGRTMEAYDEGALRLAALVPAEGHDEPATA